MRSLDGPLRMGIWRFPALGGPLTNAQAPLHNLHPHSDNPFIIGVFLRTQTDAFQLRSISKQAASTSSFPDNLVTKIAAADYEMTWLDHPIPTTELTSRNRDEKVNLHLRLPTIAENSYFSVIYAYGSDSLDSFRNFHPMHTETFFSSQSDLDLQARYGKSAYICGLTTGAGTGDDIELKMDSNIFVKHNGSNSTTWLPYPIPTTLMNFQKDGEQYPLVGNITVGASGLVTVMWYRSQPSAP